MAAEQSPRRLRQRFGYHNNTDVTALEAESSANHMCDFSSLGLKIEENVEVAVTAWLVGPCVAAHSTPREGCGGGGEFLQRSTSPIQIP